ncbi:cobaltochelatase subunit CobN [Pseudomaricurvus alcaniphilus]|uniref:cobaltochelatase subunit CobN n=1 Tax=Pseudomaricurvus alcaniphilus TaxID=1166482 RepID=UPI001FB5F492|nr:cobaltochelatase subunit CobN [Pseudomaricurvus alcaniphilus]
MVLVSQRNAETVAEAARQFQQRYPQLAIEARTDTQVRQQLRLQNAALINDSLGVVAIGMYGPVVAELKALLAPLQKPLLVFNSDHQLVKLSQLRGRAVFEDEQRLREISQQRPADNFDSWLQQQEQQYPQQADWIRARSYWQAGGSDNTSQLFSWIYRHLGQDTSPAAPAPVPRLRWLYQGQFSDHLPALGERPLLAIIDHAGGGRPADSALLRGLCNQAQQHSGSDCLVALASWGEAGVDAAQQLQAYAGQLSAVVMLQDFVVGAGEGRADATAAFQRLNVPLLNAIKLRDRTALERHLSSDGISRDKVYYQVAMPELQGASQPLVVATAGEQIEDPLTGIQVQAITPLAEEIDALLARVQRWHTLKTRANRDKRIAIIYYNHPPGRHNIGSDNLDVPASLWQILQQLKSAGYNTGELPPTQQALLDMMQERGVNLPRDAKALSTMDPKITRVAAASYRRWFEQLPAAVQREMEFGPLGLLHEQLGAAIEAGKPELATTALEHTMEELLHLLEGVDHKARQRALALLDQLQACYQQLLDPKQQSRNDTPCMNDALAIISALQQTGIEGLGGWGEAPGKVMTLNNQLLLPGLTFGNVFIGPQPPRGWEINEELLHANLVFPPSHQYLAFYQYLRDDFKADALVHLGRHSTYEFLPRRAVGLASDDYSRIVAADIPGIYPYIVDGVGEGIQAKRRGLAVMVDHLTPPLKSTDLYDELLQLRQLIESFETSHGGGNQAVAKRLVEQIRAKLDQLELKEELAESMSAELAIMGISFDEVDDDMLVHEVGHYLTTLQEKFMPLGLHIYGKDWSEEAVDMMLESMAPADKPQRLQWQQQLRRSPAAELSALLNGLSGGFVAPGQGNDPIRSPDSLPTGRNFYALDSSLIPSRVAWELGRQMAAEARQRNRDSGQQNPDKREALVLWASDVVRDEGVMIAFGLDMLGLEPVWNSRGLVKGLQRQVLGDDRVRRDTVFTTSGLFRDLYGQQLQLLNHATLMALDASADTIIRDYPALTLALQQALLPLGAQATGGAESLQQNQLARHWVKQARALLAEGHGAEDAGVVASLRVFGDAPGSYGAGINRLVERSGAWEQRSELAEVYLRRLGHSYGSEDYGQPAAAAFRTLLSEVENTYFGRSSNLYGLIDNNDAFDYLGGLSLAVETLSGTAPNNFVLDHSNPQQVRAQPLSVSLRQELRGRFLNPEWLQGLMQHGYAGARTMGSEFLEYLWGWQVTNPALVGDWAWEEVKAVYLDDRYGLQLDQFLEQGHNVHVKSNMLAVMLVAVHKGFWQADGQTVAELASGFAELVSVNGLPGSGHTDPDHPMLPWLQQHLSAEQWQALAKIIDAARAEPEQPTRQLQEIHRLTEVQLQAEQEGRASRLAAVESEQQAVDQQAPPNTSEQPHTDDFYQWQWLALALLVLVVGAGFYRGIRHANRG